MLAACIQRDGPAVPLPIKWPQSTPWPWPGALPRGRVGTSPAGGDQGPLTKFFPQVEWVGYCRVRGSLYVEVTDFKTDPHSVNFLSRAVGKSTQAIAFISLILQGVYHRLTQEAGSGFCFIQWFIQFWDGNKFRIDTVTMESLFLKYFTL